MDGLTNFFLFKENWVDGFWHIKWFGLVDVVVDVGLRKMGQIWTFCSSAGLPNSGLCWVFSGLKTYLFILGILVGPSSSVQAWFFLLHFVLLAWFDIFVLVVGFLLVGPSTLVWAWHFLVLLVPFGRAGLSSLVWAWLFFLYLVLIDLAELFQGNLFELILVLFWPVVGSVLGNFVLSVFLALTITFILLGWAEKLAQTSN